MSSDDVESALIGELRNLAGVNVDTNAFILRGGDHTIKIEYEQFSSGPSTLEFTTTYDEAARVASKRRAAPAGTTVVATRPLDIVLRREDDEDRESKLRGINVEWQTGDASFDASVYVSAPNHDAAVYSAVINSDVRAAIKTLFALGFSEVLIDAHGVIRARVIEFVIARPTPERGRSALEAFVRLLDALPALSASGEKHPPIPLSRTTRAFAWGTGISGTIMFCLMMAPLFMRLDPNANLLRFLTGIVGPWIALALALPVFIVVKRSYGGRVTSLMRGTSRASTTGNRAGTIAGLFAWFTVAALIHCASIATIILPG